MRRNVTSFEATAYCHKTGARLEECGVLLFISLFDALGLLRWTHPLGTCKLAGVLEDTMAFILAALF